MKEHAKKQLAPINIRQVKETLKKIAPEAFDKMIIAENEPIRRCNFIYVKLKYQRADRIVEKIKFPLYPSLKDLFAELEGGTAKFGEKAKMPSEKILETLQKSLSKEGLPILEMDAENPFVFPFDSENDEISQNQTRYFFPNHTFKERCNQCYGHKFVNCQDFECNCRHTWECTNCNGQGILHCNHCGGKKTVDCTNCNGALRIKCRRCSGDGKVNDGFLARTVFSFLVKEKKCGDCAGKGYIPCTACKNGKVACKECRGIGKVICPECSSQGTITCFDCYGDKERLGKTNCPQCQAEGETAQIVYVKTRLTSHKADKFILEGPQPRISENQIKSHISPEIDYELVYKKVNDQVFENYNEYNRLYAKDIEKDLGIFKSEFPMLIKEEIFYQVMACIELSYKHILTNTIHDLVIIDFWNKPEVIYYSEPEQLKRDAGNLKKVAGRLFGKLFKTKSFKRKRDYHNEIILLINLAKIDGTIEENEKQKLSQMISNLSDFTNAEKQKLFDVLNAYPLPELGKADVSFSTAEKGQEVLKKLTDLASSDGEMAIVELALIEKIRGLMKE